MSNLLAVMLDSKRNTVAAKSVGGVCLRRESEEAREGNLNKTLTVGVDLI